MTGAKKIFPIVKNKKAYHNYNVLQTYEAGISLLGYEVKSIRQKEVNLEGSFVKIDDDEPNVYNLYIKPYKFHTFGTIDASRTRKLLLKSREIKNLSDAVRLKGVSLVPLEIYFKGSWAKLKIGLCKGKKLFDKRQSLKDKDVKRRLDKSFKSKYKI